MDDVAAAVVDDVVVVVAAPAVVIAGDDVAVVEVPGDIADVVAEVDDVGVDVEAGVDIATATADVSIFQ